MGCPVGRMWCWGGLHPGFTRGQPPIEVLPFRQVAHGLLQHHELLLLKIDPSLQHAQGIVLTTHLEDSRERLDDGFKREARSQPEDGDQDDRNTQGTQNERCEVNGKDLHDSGGFERNAPMRATFSAWCSPVRVNATLGLRRMRIPFHPSRHDIRQRIRTRRRRTVSTEEPWAHM